MTRQEAKDYLLSLNGQGLDYDGAYGYQCVDAYNYYYQYLTGVSPYANGYGVEGAKDLWGVNTSKFDKIANDPSDPNQLPQTGDILIYNGSWGGGYGHVEMVLDADSNGVNVIGQNFTGRRDPMTTAYRSWGSIVGGLIGWMSFRDYTTNTPQQPALGANQRQVGNEYVNYREGPNTGANIIKTFEPNDVLDFKGFVRGENVSGNPIWFVGAYSGGFCWSGAFTDSGTNGLPDLTPAPEVVIPPPPVAKPYTFTKDLDCVTEVIPLGTDNFEYGNFPAKPEKAVIHDFGTLGTDSVNSVINAFNHNSGRIAGSHFVVAQKRIVQMCSLKDRAYHAGPNGNNFVGIETDPAQDTDTINSVRTLLTELKKKYGYQLALVEHNSLMNTMCGDDVDLKNYDLTVAYPPEKPQPPVTPPEPEKPVEPPVNGLQALLKLVLDILNKILGGNMTPITGTQWRSVLTNTLFAFFAAFLPIIISSGSFDKATLVAGATAGAMAGLKIIQKLFTKE